MKKVGTAILVLVFLTIAAAISFMAWYYTNCAYVPFTEAPALCLSI